MIRMVPRWIRMDDGESFAPTHSSGRALIRLLLHAKCRWIPTDLIRKTLNLPSLAAWPRGETAKGQESRRTSCCTSVLVRCLWGLADWVWLSLGSLRLNRLSELFRSFSLKPGYPRASSKLWARHPRLKRLKALKASSLNQQVPGKVSEIYLALVCLHGCLCMILPCWTADLSIGAEPPCTLECLVFTKILDSRRWARMGPQRLKNEHVKTVLLKGRNRRYRRLKTWDNCRVCMNMYECMHYYK